VKLNLAEAASKSEGGRESGNQGSEYGVPPEIAAEDEREALRVADWHACQEREREQQEDNAKEAIGDDSSVEEVKDALPLCPPLAKLKPEEKKAWDETVVVVGHCRIAGTKVSIKIPSDLDGKWSNAQKAMWHAAKMQLRALRNRFNGGCC